MPSQATRPNYRHACILRRTFSGMNTLWQQYVSAVLGEDNQSDAAKKTRVNQTTLGRWIRGEVRPTNAANVAAFAQDYGRNVLEAFVAAELLRAGVDTRVTQELMRHVSMATTQRYLHVDDDQRRAAIRLLPDLAAYTIAAAIASSSSLPTTA